MLHWIIAAISLWMAYLLREEFPPFIIGAVIAYLLAGPVNLLTKKAKMPRGLAVAIIYILSLGGISLAIYKGQPFIAEEAKSLFANRQEIVENVVGQISNLTGWSPDISDVASQVLDKIQHFVTGKPEELLSYGGKISHGILTTFICLVVSIYMLYDGKSIGRFFLRFIPENKRDHGLQVAAEINNKFSRYVAGQMILVGLMAVLAFIVFCCFSIKYALLLAVLIGLLEIVPIIGPLFALSLAMLVTSSQLGLSTGLTVMAILWVIRLVEDYVVIPRIIGHAVQLHPVVTIFSVLAGETLAGGLGMLLAVPFAAAVKVVIDRTHPAIPVPPGPNHGPGSGPEDKPDTDGGANNAGNGGDGGAEAAAGAASHNADTAERRPAPPRLTQNCYNEFEAMVCLGTLSQGDYWEAEKDARDASNGLSRDRQIWALLLERQQVTEEARTQARAAMDRFQRDEEERARQEDLSRQRERESSEYLRSEGSYPYR